MSNQDETLNVLLYHMFHIRDASDDIDNAQERKVTRHAELKTEFSDGGWTASYHSFKCWLPRFHCIHEI